MNLHRRSVRLLFALGAVAMACAASRDVSGQGAGEQEVKAAYLYNFAKFVEWPPDALPAGALLTLCVLDDEPFRRVLAESVRGRRVDAHDVGTLEITLGGTIRQCHVLYAPGIAARDAEALVKAANGTAVFTVSDRDGFAGRGGVANFFREGDRLRIAINVDAARRARLQISSRLLALATLVKEQAPR